MIQRRKRLQRKTPLKKGGYILRKTPIRKVSSKRAKQLREYSKARKEFLEANPVCQVWIAENPNLEWWNSAEWGFYAPQSSEVHHIDGREHARLLDQTKWLAVCRANHERIHREPKWAREMGFLT